MGEFLDTSTLEALATPAGGSGEAGRARALSATLIPAVRQQLALLLEERGAELGAPLVECLAPLTGGEPLDAETALGIPIAHVTRAIHDRGFDAAWAAAGVAAACAARGRAAPWRATFASPRQVRFGAALSAPATTLEWWPTAGGAEVRADGARAAVARDALTPDAAAASLPAGWTALTTFRMGEAYACLSPPAPSDALWVEARPAYTSAPLEEVRAVARRAVDTIRAYAPEYLPWIDRVVRDVVPIASPATVSVSRSIKGEHGVLYASFPSDVTHTAEVLVHEAAHQYFNVVEHRLWFADLMADDRLYYSPYVKKDRTIDRILLTYHAFANVLLFHRKCLAAGMDPASYTGNDLGEQEQMLATLDGYLSSSPGLTRAGRAMFEPLRAQVGRLT